MKTLEVDLKAIYFGIGNHIKSWSNRHLWGRIKVKYDSDAVRSLMNAIWCDELAVYAHKKSFNAGMKAYRRRKFHEANRLLSTALRESRAVGLNAESSMKRNKYAEKNEKLNDFMQNKLSKHISERE